MATHDLPPDIAELSAEKALARIVCLNSGIQRFWSSVEGWAPIAAAGLLARSRLDWQVSLSRTLRLWVDGPRPDEEAGSLILAWANLGALVEGTLKWFLSVFLEDYRKDINAIKKKGDVQDPDSITIEPLRVFCRKSVWTETEGRRWDAWVRKIQQRRNAVHAFQHRELGTVDEFVQDVRWYLAFLRAHNDRVPYPDDVYQPSEQ